MDESMKKKIVCICIILAVFAGGLLLPDLLQNMEKSMFHRNRRCNPSRNSCRKSPQPRPRFKHRSYNRQNNVLIAPVGSQSSMTRIIDKVPQIFCNMTSSGQQQGGRQQGSQQQNKQQQ